MGAVPWGGGTAGVRLQGRSREGPGEPVPDPCAGRPSESMAVSPLGGHRKLLLLEL